MSSLKPLAAPILAALAIGLLACGGGSSSSASIDDTPQGNDVGASLDPFPGHLADRDQPLDPLFQLREGTETGQAHDPRFRRGVDRVFLTNVDPWVRLGLLKTQRDAVPLGIDPKYFDLDLLAG